ncbi:MAG: extracellular solute-binding protein [Betaproteobacteria bacterium]
MKRRRLACWVLALAIAGGSSAMAQPAAPEGAAMDARIVEAARREGMVNLYSSMNEKDIRALAGAFEKKYGIRVSVWRSGKNKVLQRTIAESGAGRHEADVVHNPAPEMEALHNEKLLVPVRSPAAANLIGGLVPAHGDWVPLRVYVFVQAYNTNAVSKEELPRSFDDLLAPRWKGRLGIEAKEQEWFATLVQTMGEQRGLQLFREMAAVNGLSVRSGNSLLTNMVVSGEVPMGLTVYSYLADQAKAKGAPIDYVVLKPAIAYTDGIGVLGRAPHPNAARLFYDFMLNDGEAIMKAQMQLTAHRQDEAAVRRFDPVFIDPARVLRDYDKWAQLYDDTITGRAPRSQAAR